MNRAEPDKYFVLNNGVAIRDIKELALVLYDVPEDVFGFHVNEGKNDFSSWIRDVFGEESLAKNLDGMMDKKDVQLALFKHIIK